MRDSGSTSRRCCSPETKTPRQPRLRGVFVSKADLLFAINKEAYIALYQTISDIKHLEIQLIHAINAS
jgi:hypothetical protein